jgi:hypothetical protein
MVRPRKGTDQANVNMKATFFSKLERDFWGYSPIILLIVALFSFLLLRLPSAFALNAQSSSALRKAHKWADDQYKRNSAIVKGYFRLLATKNRNTTPSAEIEPTKLPLFEASNRNIPVSINGDYALTTLREYRVRDQSLIEAAYELTERDAPLKRIFSFFLKHGDGWKPLIFPFEVASLAVTTRSGTMPVLLSVIEGGHGSGTICRIYTLNLDNTIEQLMELHLWQDSMVRFIDFDMDGQPELLHVTLSYFPKELITLIGPDEDIAGRRFYKAEIYKWIDNPRTAARPNKFKSIGVKYYWELPPFLKAGFSIREGWDRCYALSASWIAKVVSINNIYIFSVFRGRMR